MTTKATSSATGQRVPAETLEAFCVEAMLRTGMREADAHTTARVLVTTDLWGIFTHGTRHLRNYLRKIRAGGIVPLAVPEVIAEGPAWSLVDGHGAMGMVSACFAMDRAIEKARLCGIGYATVRSSVHFGAAGYYANMALPHDMVGLAMSNADPNMVAPGARSSTIGNNPFAYAVPAGVEKPVFLDIAMSTVASSKILAAQGLGLPIPDNWLVDEDGIPTTDTSRYPQSGSLMPMAGHKGYGLAVLIEVLSGVLAGAAVTGEATSWLLNLPSQPNLGHTFIAIDVNVMMPVATFKARMDAMIQGIHQAPKAHGADRIFLPGEKEWESFERATRLGIELPADVLKDIMGLGQDVGLSFSDLIH